MSSNSYWRESSFATNHYTVVIFAGQRNKMLWSSPKLYRRQYLSRNFQLIWCISTIADNTFRLLVIQVPKEIVQLKEAIITFVSNRLSNFSHIKYQIRVSSVIIISNRSYFYCFKLIKTDYWKSINFLWSWR